MMPCLEASHLLVLVANGVSKHLPCSQGPLWRQLVRGLHLIDIRDTYWLYIDPLQQNVGEGKCSRPSTEVLVQTLDGWPLGVRL